MGRTDEGFEAVDHTADVALHVWAPDLERLFLQAALGLTHFLTDPSRVRPLQRVALRIEGLDREELLVAWLGEILYRWESDALLLTEFAELRIEETAKGFQLHATARGERWDGERHASGVGVKAATYHGLNIRPDTQGRFDLTIVLDT